MGGGTAKKVYLYKNGVQNVSFESPGGYYYPGETNTPATFLSDHISIINGANNVVFVGTVAKIDFTDYTAVHVISRRNSGNSTGCSLRTSTSKNVQYYTTRTFITNSGTDYSEFVLDVSGITGEQYLEIDTNSYSMDVDVKEIWLSKS